MQSSQNPSQRSNRVRKSGAIFKNCQGLKRGFDTTLDVHRVSAVTLVMALPDAWCLGTCWVRLADFLTQSRLFLGSEHVVMSSTLEICSFTWHTVTKSPPSWSNASSNHLSVTKHRAGSAIYGTVAAVKRCMLDHWRNESYCTPSSFLA